MKKEITIVMAANDGWFEGVYLSVLSIVRRTKNQCHFYMLSGNFDNYKNANKMFSSYHTDIINQMTKKYNSNNFFKTMDCSKLFNETFGDMKPRKRWKDWVPFVLFKMLIHKIKELQGKVIYLDGDVMASGDINKYFEIDIKDPYEIAATRDRWIWNIFYNYIRKYFNAGVLLIDLDKIRKNKSFEKTIKFIKEKKPYRCEQTALNLCCKIMKATKKDYRFNYLRDGIRDDVVLKHFVNAWRFNPWHFGIRQWQIDKVHKYLKLHNWDEDYKIFLREKKKW